MDTSPPVIVKRSVREMLADLADSGEDASGMIQDVLDGPKPYVVLAPGTYTVKRPIVIRRSGCHVVGDPWATLAATGGFSPLMAGFASPNRRPGYRAARKVDNPLATDGTRLSYRLPGDTFLCLRTSPFEFGPGTNWPDLDGFTLAFAVSRDNPDPARPDAILCTAPDRYAPDPLDVFIYEGRLVVRIRTDDGAERQVQFDVPRGLRDVFAVVAFNFKTGRYSAYINGVASKVVFTSGMLDWRPGLRVAWPDMSDCRIGWNFNHWFARMRLHGLKISAGAVVPTGVEPGTALVRSDGRSVSYDSMLWSARNGECVLDMRRAASLGDDSDLIPYSGTTSNNLGYGLMIPGDWDPYDIATGCHVEGLALNVRGDYQGSALAWGTILKGRFSRLETLGGLRGIDNWDGPTSYTTVIDDCNFYGPGDAGLVLGFGNALCRDLTFGRHPLARSRYACKVRCTTGEIDGAFVAGQSKVIDVIRLWEVPGRMRLSGWLTNWETPGQGPIRSYVHTDRAPVGSTGQGQTIIVHGFEASAAPQTGPYILAEDRFPSRPGWARLAVEDSFTVAYPGKLVEAKGAWAVEGAVSVKGKVATGVELPRPSPVADPADPGASAA